MLWAVVIHCVLPFYTVTSGKGGGHSWVYRSVVGFSRYSRSCCFLQTLIGNGDNQSLFRYMNRWVLKSSSHMDSSNSMLRMPE